MKAISKSSENLRAADLGLKFPGQAGAFNAITDLAGVTVGYTTVIKGEGKLMVGPRANPNRCNSHPS